MWLNNLRIVNKRKHVQCIGNYDEVYILMKNGDSATRNRISDTGVR